jgi:cytidine deaminase
MEVDWETLRAAAVAAMRNAYAPYSRFPVGAAALVDDGRIVVGCNVENAAYGVVLCAECGVVSSLHATGGGRLVALSCVDATGLPLMPCGRCRQLLWEHGGPQCLVEAVPRPLSMAELLPHAFGRDDLDAVTGSSPAPGPPSRAPAPGPPSQVPVLSPESGSSSQVPALSPASGSSPDVPESLRRWRGRGTVFVHPDLQGGEQVWTGYWERSAGTGAVSAADVGILEEGPIWAAPADAVAWGRMRTPRVVVVDADGALAWAGDGDPPEGIGVRWQP